MSERGRDYFIMSLAYALGMTRHQLLNSLDSRELTMWSAFFEEMNNPKAKDKPTATVEKSLKGILQGQPRKRRHA